MVDYVRVERSEIEVDDLLEISRITIGKIGLQKEVLNFSDVVSSAIRIEADGVRLAQVIVNLLSNAAKYTPPGGDILLVARVKDGPRRTLTPPHRAPSKTPQAA